MADAAAEALVAVLVVCLVGAGVFVGWVIGHYVGGGATTVTVNAASAPATTTTATATPASIQTAPAFSTSDLTALPKQNWITNGGTTWNQRYSPLDQIDTSNVSQLKGVWRTHLRGSAVAAKYSAEGQPIVYKGTIYIPTGEDDVFAIDARSGKILWEHKGNLDQEISVVCCGWESRGIALGEGKVYIGRLDGSVEALDQKTGKRVWISRLEPWQTGYSITAAPLYYDGMVITGISGGEFLARGRVTALDAKTGKEKWRFYTIPGPGEVGHDTWPTRGDAWKRGGAPVWQTPALDPKLGLLYFSTGNAAPDLDGSQRAGDNLFTASIVAIDAKTGKYKWHYQMVHHDIWDFDAPSPVVLFDATIDGKLRHGLGEPSKTGWLYLLDRTDGKPLFPIPEKAVPQNPQNKTAATQPIPSYQGFVSQKVTPAMVNAVEKAVAGVGAKGPVPDVVAQKRIYDPVFGKKMTVFSPAAQGGDNWQPSSYNPNTHMFYICAQEGFAGYTYAPAAIKALKPKQAQKSVVGGVLELPTGFGKNVGTLTAFDVTTGTIAWQHRWPESCYAGTTTTAGNLVFVGRSSGEYQAYDAKSGKLLWSYQTGAGANDTSTSFELDGQQMLVLYSGGNALAASPHGDIVTLFSLKGKLPPAKAPGAGKGTQHAGGAPPTQNESGSAAAGKKVFAANCSVCHGATGHGGNGGPDLTSIPSAKTYSVVLGQVTNGGGGMPSFKGTLSQQQIADVATYVIQEITHGKK